MQQVSNVICKKCGAEATSKCPYCRNVFPVDMTVAMIRQIIDVDFDADDCTVKIHYKGTREGSNWESFILMMIAMRRITSEEMFNQVKCSHNWAFAEGCESTIGCGHTN